MIYVNLFIVNYSYKQIHIETHFLTNENPCARSLSLRRHTFVFIAYYALTLIVRVLTIPQYTFIDSINDRYILI